MRRSTPGPPGTLPGTRPTPHTSGPSTGMCPLPRACARAALSGDRARWRRVRLRGACVPDLPSTSAACALRSHPGPERAHAHACTDTRLCVRAAISQTTCMKWRRDRLRWPEHRRQTSAPRRAAHADTICDRHDARCAAYRCINSSQDADPGRVCGERSASGNCGVLFDAKSGVRRAFCSLG